MYSKLYSGREGLGGCMTEGRTGCFRLKLGPDGIAILVRLHVRAKDFMVLGKTKSKIWQSLGRVNESKTCNVRNNIELNI